MLNQTEKYLTAVIAFIFTKVLKVRKLEIENISGLFLDYLFRYFPDRKFKLLLITHASKQTNMTY